MAGCIHGISAVFGQGPRAERKDKNRAKVEINGAVTYDFSDWSIDNMNLTTSSHLFGIRPGTLRIHQDSSSYAITSGKRDIGTGSDIVYIYKWCCKMAGEENEDYRQFYFEDGKFVGGSWRRISTPRSMDSAVSEKRHTADVY